MNWNGPRQAESNVSRCNRSFGRRALHVNLQLQGLIQDADLRRHLLQMTRHSEYLQRNFVRPAEIRNAIIQVRSVADDGLYYGLEDHEYEIITRNQSVRASGKYGKFSMKSLQGYWIVGSVSVQLRLSGFWCAQLHAMLPWTRMIRV